MWTLPQMTGHHPHYRDLPSWLVWRWGESMITVFLPLSWTLLHMLYSMTLSLSLSPPLPQPTHVYGMSTNSSCDSRSVTPSPMDLKPIYEAESPDELALVDAAYKYGFRLLRRSLHNVLVSIPGTILSCGCCLPIGYALILLHYVFMMPIIFLSYSILIFWGRQLLMMLSP